MNILVICDTNKRAAIASIRSLIDKDVRMLFGINSIRDNRVRLYLNKYGKEGIVKYSNASKKEFIDSLFRIKESRGPFKVLPIGEKLARWMAEDKQILVESSIFPLVANYTAYKTLSDKGCFLNLCETNGIKVPKKLNSLPASKYEKPFVVKPNAMATSDKVLNAPFIVESQGGLTKLHKAKLDYSKHFFEEFIDGPSIYYCALYVNKKKVSSFTQINIAQQPSGKSVIKAFPYADLPESTKEKIDVMFFSLGYEGVMMMELKQSLSNKLFYAIECNPRLWGPLQLSLDNGVNFVSELCGIPSPLNRKTNIGYVWRTGYLDGWFIKRKNKSSFKKFDFSFGSRKRFIDVWARKDTFLYAICEPLFVLLGHLLNLKK